MYTKDPLKDGFTSFLFRQPSFHCYLSLVKVIKFNIYTNVCISKPFQAVYTDTHI